VAYVASQEWHGWIDACSKLLSNLQQAVEKLSEHLEAIRHLL